MRSQIVGRAGPGLRPTRSRMSFRVHQPDLTKLEGVKAWLRAALRDYRWRVRGILLDDNKVFRSPPEPALIAKVVEVSVIEHVKRKALIVRGLDVLDDLSGRGHPDILLTGRAVGSQKVAIDAKVARRNTPKRGTPTRTQSRHRHRGRAGRPRAL